MIKYISVNMNLLSFTEHCHLKKKNLTKINYIFVSVVLYDSNIEGK